MKALGETATHLPWLCPRASSLVALARVPVATAWSQLRIDPGAVLLVARQAPEPSTLLSSSRQTTILEDALGQLAGTGAGFVEWNAPTLEPIYRSCLRHAQLAARLAAHAKGVEPEAAWVAGLLAPLGWLAMSAVDTSRTLACLNDPRFPQSPASAQERGWGLDQASIARRLCRRWNLPRWLSAVVSHLDLDAETAQGLGAEPSLLRIVQLAVAISQRRGVSLELSVGGTPERNAAALGIPAAVLDSLTADTPVPEPALTAWDSPLDMPLLRDLLHLALEKRRLSEQPALENLERDVDNLHRAVREQRATEDTRLRDLKLAALAEFAAGAGHEINNPLAVMSGQAQYLLTHEPDPNRQKALQAIIGQAQRIHQILSELMQFARPSRPHRQPIDLAVLVTEVAATQAELAEARRVRLVCPTPAARLIVHADQPQLRTALACLLRNAVEAAPADGWAGLRLDTEQPDRLLFLIEDNGPGPAPAPMEHLFDPFYSGRQAGRGRGLGLPTAWQLARGHGGEVRFDGSAEGVTRFVLGLPWSREHAFSGVPAIVSEPRAAVDAELTADANGTGLVTNGHAGP